MRSQRKNVMPLERSTATTALLLLQFPFVQLECSKRKRCQFLVYSTLLPPPSLWCSYNCFFKCVQAPVCKRSAIHLSVIVVSRRNCAASPIFTGSDLRRRLKSASVQCTFL